MVSKRVTWEMERGQSDGSCRREKCPLLSVWEVGKKDASPAQIAADMSAG